MKRAAVVAGVLAALTTGVSAQSLPELLKPLIVKWNTPTEPFTIIGNIN